MFNWERHIVRTMLDSRRLGGGALAVYIDEGHYLHHAQEVNAGEPKYPAGELRLYRLAGRPAADAAGKSRS